MLNNTLPSLATHGFVWPCVEGIDLFRGFDKSKNSIKALRKRGHSSSFSIYAATLRN